MTARSQRLRGLRAPEIGHRLRAGARIQAQRAAAAISTPTWNRARLRRILTDAASAAIAPAAARGDWMAAHQRLEALFIGRPSRFVLRPDSAEGLRREVLRQWPDAARAAAATGDRLLRGRYDLLGYKDLSFGDNAVRVDWHTDPVHHRACPLAFWADIPYLDPRYGDHKIIWELNRQQHWLALGRALWLTEDDRYAQAIIAQLEGWLAANPPLTGINWASMLELGLRSLSWVWALHFLLGRGPSADPHPWLVDLLVGLDRQLTHVERNLSRYFSPNTHLTGEALALYVTGVAVPELSRSERWVRTGRQVLLQEVSRQIGRDGGHVERSFHYHRYTLDFYLLALLTAERAGDTEASCVFAATVERLSAFLLEVADDRGWIQQVGDDDGGMLWPGAGRDPRDVRDSLALAAVAVNRPDLAPWGPAEEAYWIAWGSRRDALSVASYPDTQPRHETPVRTTLFHETGYAVVRTRHGDHLVFDVGPHGYLNGGHAHADALAVTLSVSGRPLLVDPGTASYTVDASLRDRMRGTAAHNTLTLDGQPSSYPAGPFQWQTRTDARREAVRSNGRLTWIEAVHDGFSPLSHRRSIVHDGNGIWWFIDSVEGGGAHVTDLFWHFDPSWSVTAPGNGVIRAAQGDAVWMLHDGGDVTLDYGDEHGSASWYSPRYGALVPAWTARITRSDVAPFSLVTCLVHGDAGSPPPTREAIRGAGDAGAPTSAMLVRRGGETALLMLRPGDSAARVERHCDIGPFRTDARLFTRASSRDGGQTLAMADARYLFASGDDSLSVIADMRLVDLHISTTHGQMDLWSSAPASLITLRGDIASTVHRLRLNGRELNVRRPSSSDRIVIHPLDWSRGLAPDALSSAFPGTTAIPV